MSTGFLPAPSSSVMLNRRRIAIPLSRLAVCVLAVSTAHATPPHCSRDSLNHLADAYVSAMSAHDPARVHFAKNVRMTENGQIVQVGKGLWQSAGPVSFERKVLDTGQCALLTQAVLQENGSNIIVATRLQLAKGRVSEVETLIARPKVADKDATQKQSYELGGKSFELFGFSPDKVAMEDGDHWNSILPLRERRSREELTKIADSYFTLFDKPDTAVPFAPYCNRFENGVETTRGVCPYAGAKGGLKVTNRRYPVTDVDAGIAVGYVLFGGNLLDLHIFKIRNGQITQIQAVTGPPSNTTGWEN
jgi:hypothetical protein